MGNKGISLLKHAFASESEFFKAALLNRVENIKICEFLFETHSESK